MKLTPLDIKKQDFSKSLRGYDPEEVDAFLSMLANQWEVLQDEKRRAEERNRDLKNKIEHYENVEEALQEALQTARENKEQVLSNARREAEVIVREAKSEAQDICGEAADQHKQLKREVSQLSDRRGEIVARLRAFLMSEMELLARFDGEDPSGFIKLVPEEGRKQPQETEPKQVSEGDPAVDNAAESQEEEVSSPRAEAKPQSEPPQNQDQSHDQRAGADDDHADVHEFVSQFSRDKEDFINPSHPDAPDAESPSQEVTGSNEDAFQTTDSARPDAEVPQEASRADVDRQEDEDSPSWIVHSLFQADEDDHLADREESVVDAEGEDEEDVTASSEEIEKIRRILSDMDD